MRDNLARVMPVEHPKAKRRHKKQQFNYRLATTLGVIFVLSMVMMVRFAAISQLEKDIKDTKNTLKELQAQNKQIELKLEKDMSVAELESIAISQYNMHKPIAGQVVYIDVKNTDSGNTYGKKENKQSYGAFMMQGISGLVEYLR